MKKLLTLFTVFFAIRGLSADVRVINNIHVNIDPVHEWFLNHEGKRPMPHWKQIRVLDFTPGGPWPSCTISAEGISKTVYLNNLSPSAIQYWNQVAQLRSRITSLKEQIAEDTKNLRIADSQYADVGSQYDQSREAARARLHNENDDLESMSEQLSLLMENQRVSISDFAMFTGQVYNGKEVWDCGIRTTQ